MKAIAHLAIDLSRIVEMKPAKGVAVIDEQMAVRDVQCVIEAENRSPKKLTGESSTVA